MENYIEASIGLKRSNQTLYFTLISLKLFLSADTFYLKGFWFFFLIQY